MVRESSRKALKSSRKALKKIKSGSMYALKKFKKSIKNRRSKKADDKIKKNKFRFSAIEIIAIQYILQIFMWLAINSNFLDFYELEADFDHHRKKKEKGWFTNPFSVPKEKFENFVAPYMKLIKQSLLDAALTTSLKTIYNNLKSHEEKTIFIGMMIFLLYFLKRGEIKSMGITDFLSNFDITKKGTAFKNMAKKLSPKYKGKNPPMPPGDGFSTASEEEEDSWFSSFKKDVFPQDYEKPYEPNIDLDQKDLELD